MVNIALVESNGNRKSLRDVITKCFWQKDPSSFSGHSLFYSFEKALSQRPHSSRWLVCNVYDNNAPHRFYGQAMFHVMSLLSGSRISSPLTRPGRDDTKNFIMYIDNYTLKGGWHSKDMNTTIGNSVDSLAQNPMSIVFKSIELHQDYFENNPAVSREEYSRYKWPIWRHGKFYVPGWKFPNMRALYPTDVSVYEDATLISRQRENIFTPANELTTNEVCILAVSVTVTYSNSTPYSLEQDPLAPEDVAEYFAPMRLRSFGDCEDVSWEIGNAKKEIVELDPAGMSPTLRKIREILSQYAEFMTLVSATATDAGAASSENSARQAHMLTLFIPKYDLVKAGMLEKTPGVVLQSDLPILIGEGTGRVHPIQMKGHFPKNMSERGWRWQNDMVTTYKTRGAKRTIFSPSTSSGVVADFYADLISGYNDDTGLIDFRMRGTDATGVPITTLLDKNYGEFNMVSVPGTRPRNEPAEDRVACQILSGFHEPVMPLPKTTTQAPVSSVVLYIRKHFPQAINMVRRDATLILPFQSVDSEDEASFLKFIKSQQSSISEVEIIQQNISNVGAYQFNIKLM